MAIEKWFMCIYFVIYLITINDLYVNGRKLFTININITCTYIHTHIYIYIDEVYMK